MSDEMDPEVLRDMQLRDATIRERPMRSGPVMAFGSWPPVIVTTWPCRAPKCGQPVEVTEDVVHALAVNNAELQRRGERPIPTSGIVLCDACRELAAWYRVEAINKRRVRLRDAIQKLKEHDNPRTASELISELHECHHPDIEGLLQSLDEKRQAGKKGRKL